MRKALPISLGIVLALGLLAGSAAAERVWTKTATSLRAEPDPQSRRVARIKANRSLTVVRKKGRWLKVKRGAKSGWILRSDIRSQGRRRRGRGGRRVARASQSRNAGSSADEADDAGSSSADDAAEAAGEATASDETTSDAAAAPDGDRSDDSDGEGSADAGPASGQGSEEACRKDAVWCDDDRGSDAFHVKVIPERAQAYKEPGVNQELAFWTTKGQELVVIGYHRPDWFYVQTLEGKFGWIPKSAVLREGNLRDPESPERLETRLDDLPELDPDSVREQGTGSSGQAGGAASSDGASSLTIDAVAAVGVGVLARSLSTSGGQANYDASSPGAVTHVSAAARYRVSGSWHAGAEGLYTAMVGVPGVTYTPAGAESLDLGSFILHRFTATGSFGYVGGFAALLRAGFLVETFYLNALFNPGNVPRERLISPSVGVELGVADIAAGLDVTLQADVLLGGALAQTGGLEDGSFDGATAAVGVLDLAYPLGERLAIHGIYRFELLAPSWTGPSARAPGVNGASRTDVTHRVLGGIGMRF